MKVTFLFILFSLLAGCSSENNQSTGVLSDFIKADYSHNQSIISCELLADKNLNSVERFIPLFVDKLNKARKKDDEVIFFFPIQMENSSISKFKILLNHKDEVLIDEMNKALADLSFEETALCNTEDSSYGRLSLFESEFESTLAVVEMMECKYVNNFNYATMKLVFEEFIDALVKVDQKVSIIYSENLNVKSNFRWFIVFESMESRRVFVEDWQDLSVSNQIQILFTEQSRCGASKLYESFKVI
jgi:hypothetical protein